MPMTQVWAMTPVMESAMWSLMLIFWDWDIGSGWRLLGASDGWNAEDAELESL